ncbi:hypothetical protein ZOSMA_17G00550 [Zostera marina]|uniref:SH2 domain-containing protein n=1 Tax=Zostera marina TaxID=29655 RepID=A0A0K9PTD5_ZOSMR|nr:hypothetical protein ZOSMA_17G00550 [Zostera marina]
MTSENLIPSGMMEDLASDSENVDARVNPFSDEIVFKYCLDGTKERFFSLKEKAIYSTEKELADFADQVSLYSGCSHHRYQISIAKQLIQEGSDSWNTISGKDLNHAPLLVDAFPEIERRFQKISHSSRGLSWQDMDVLRRIAGCDENGAMNRENFDRLWFWMYPVAFTLSKEHMKVLWESLQPRWIQGLITREEAQNALFVREGQREEVQKPGTFVLRFPTSRSWPHPDAGSLVVTYVGADSNIHNKLISLHDQRINSKPFSELLLEEPELLRLGSVGR